MYLLYSRLINVVVIPKFYKLIAQFFTLLSYEPKKCASNQPVLRCTISILYLSCEVIFFDLQRKAFSYNKKDLAWGIESSAMCVTAITMFWIDYWVNTNSKDWNYHFYTTVYGYYSICTLLEFQMLMLMGNRYLENLAHKILHTS